MPTRSKPATQTPESFNVLSTANTQACEKAGMICLALPHGRDEKEKHNHSSDLETESASAGWQSYS
jgi:hypothetical protein